jgi:hypothetical protein
VTRAASTLPSPASGVRSERVSLPPSAFAVAQRVLAPVAPAAADIMGLNVMVGRTQTEWDTRAATDRLGVTGLRTVREVLAERAALPA